MSLDFMDRALLAGIGIAIASGPLGTIMIWRRMSNFGDALGHSSLLGLCLALFLNIHLYFGLILTCLLVAYSLTLLSKRSFLGSDSILSILAYTTLSVGLILVAALKNIRIDLLAYLYGDILSISQNDLIWIYGIVLITMSILFYKRQAILSMIVHENLALIEGVPVVKLQFLVTLIMALVFAVAIKLVGILLMTGLLIIPAAAARYFSKTPEQMIGLATIFGILSVCMGIFASYQLDWPTGPAIVSAASTLFFINFIFKKYIFK